MSQKKALLDDGYNDDSEKILMSILNVPFLELGLCIYIVLVF